MTVERVPFKKECITFISEISTRGQFHKAEKFVITKIIFVITRISNFVFAISTVC